MECRPSPPVGKMTVIDFFQDISELKEAYGRPSFPSPLLMAHYFRDIGVVQTHRDLLSHRPGPADDPRPHPIPALHKSGHADDTNESHAETMHGTKLTKLLPAYFAPVRSCATARSQSDPRVSGDPVVVVRLLQTTLLPKCHRPTRNTPIRARADGDANPGNRAGRRLCDRRM
jgi:hypothetical protein